MIGLSVRSGARVFFPARPGNYGGQTGQAGGSCVLIFISPPPFVFDAPIVDVDIMLAQPADPPPDIYAITVPIRGYGRMRAGELDDNWNDGPPVTLRLLFARKVSPGRHPYRTE